MLIFRQTSEIVRPLARSRSISRSSRATSSAVRRFFMGPSLEHSTEGLPFQVDQFLGGRPPSLQVEVVLHVSHFVPADEKARSKAPHQAGHMLVDWIVVTVKASQDRVEVR